MCKAKFERCVLKVMAKGKGKDSARRICAASIFHGKKRRG